MANSSFDTILNVYCTVAVLVAISLNVFREKLAVPAFIIVGSLLFAYYLSVRFATSRRSFNHGDAVSVYAEWVCILVFLGPWHFVLVLYSVYLILFGQKNEEPRPTEPTQLFEGLPKYRGPRFG